MIRHNRRKRCIRSRSSINKVISDYRYRYKVRKLIRNALSHPPLLLTGWETLTNILGSEIKGI